MPVEDKQKEMDKALFSSLIMMLSSSAMQQLGKIVNPMTNKSEVNLEMAQMTIDMVAMLKTKTEGNLDSEEAKMMTDILSSLQMNFVETSAEANKTAEPEKDDTDSKDDKKDEDVEKKDEERDEDSSSDPKFHKSYGE